MRTRLKVDKVLCCGNQNLASDRSEISVRKAILSPIMEQVTFARRFAAILQERTMGRTSCGNVRFPAGVEIGIEGIEKTGRPSRTVASRRKPAGMAFSSEATLPDGTVIICQMMLLPEQRKLLIIKCPTAPEHVIPDTREYNLKCADRQTVEAVAKFACDYVYLLGISNASDAEELWESTKLLGSPRRLSIPCVP